MEIAVQVQTEQRLRWVELLINVAEPAPKYQPFLITDESSLLDAVGVEPQEIQRRIDCCFGERLPIPLGTPLWRFVDLVKQLCWRCPHPCNSVA